MIDSREPASPMASIGGQVRNARVSQGWTQHDLAEDAGLSRPTIARIERGDDVSTGTLVKVTASLGLTVSVSPGNAT